MGIYSVERTPANPANPQRLTILEAAERLAEEERGAGVFHIAVVDVTSPFPPFSAQRKIKSSVRKWRSRLYTAVQRMEIDHERKSNHPRSEVHLRWNDVMRWYRTNYQLVRAIL